MSNPGDADVTTITDARDLAAYLAEGAKPAETFTIGTEHEAFGFHRTDFLSPTYEEPGGIRDLLSHDRTG